MVSMQIDAYTLTERVRDTTGIHTCIMIVALWTTCVLVPDFSGPAHDKISNSLQ